MLRRCPAVFAARSAWAVLGFLSAGERVDKAAVRQRYLELARERHPDAEGGSDDQFRELKEAYESVRRGGRVSFGGGEEAQAVEVPEEELSEERLEIRRVYQTFWAQQKQKSAYRSDREREAKAAMDLMTKAMKPEYCDRSSPLGDYGVGESRRRNFRDYMSLTSDRSEVVQRGAVLTSRVAPDPDLGREYGEERRLPSPHRAVVLIIGATKGRAQGVLMNRSGFCGPTPVPEAFILHGDARAPGRQRMFAGLYRGGRTATPSVEVTSQCMWEDFELEREISTGLWSVHGRLPAQDVFRAAETHLADLPDAPQLMDGFDVTGEKFEVIRGMLTAGVFTPHPWR